MGFPRTVRGVARRIADHIEKNGHFQFPRDDYSGLFDVKHRPEGKCCIIANPLSHSVYEAEATDNQASLVRDFERALSHKVGTSRLSVWSDETPTAEVLRTLRSL